MDTKALRQKILDLAIRGKLVPQDPNDEPASVLLERIREQKMQMVKEGKLKAKDITNDTIIFVPDVLYLVSYSFRALLYGYHRILPIRILILARVFTVYRNAGTEVVEGRY